jgi:hypothetical protein
MRTEVEKGVSVTVFQQWDVIFGYIIYASDERRCLILILRDGQHVLFQAFLKSFTDLNIILRDTKLLRTYVSISIRRIIRPHCF